jgi:transcriptional regulator with XRE-family HTH domain
MGQEDSVRISLRKAADKFRRTRLEAGLSVRQLADKAELSPSTVLKIEKHSLTPSIAVCMRLADALNRKISFFLEFDDHDQDLRFVPKGQGRRVQAKEATVRTEVLAEPLVSPRMEAFLLTIDPGGSSGDEAPITYRGEEIVIGVEGRVTFTIRGEDKVVGPGDTLHFKGDIPHAWENQGPGKAQIIMACAFNYER